MRILLLLSLLCYSLNVTAQPLHFSNKVAVKVTPSSLLDIEAPQLPIGIEYMFLKNWGIGAQIGVPLFSSVHVFKDEEKVTNDMKYRLEVRRYFGGTKNKRFFVGIDAYRRAMDIEALDGIYLFSANRKAAYASVDIHRLEWGGGVYWGAMNRIAGNLFLDWHLGLGFKHVEANTSELIRKEIGPRDWGTAGLDAPNIHDITEGRTADRPEPLLALRLSYVINGKK